MTREQARREIDSLDYYLQNHTDDYGEESHTAMMMAKDALSSSENPNTCGDAISREEAVNAIYDLCGENVSLKENPWRDNPHMDAVVDALENLPSVTPQQRTGRWKFIVYDANRIGHYECTECHWNVLMNVSDYCPHCGAKMEVEE